MKITQEVRDFAARQNAAADTFLAAEEADQPVLSDVEAGKGGERFIYPRQNDAVRLPQTGGARSAPGGMSRVLREPLKVDTETDILARQRFGMDASDTKSTLYCSFCGKSQHEVDKLIAGPTVFICNECTELADDILWSDVEGRILVKVKVAATDTPFDDVLYDTLISMISEHYPDYELRYEFKTPQSGGVRTDSNYLVFSAESKVDTPSPGRFSQQFWDARHKEQAAIRTELAETLMKLSVVTQQYTMENERAANLAAELQEVKSEYLDHLRQSYPREKEQGPDLRAVMFLDISGYSKMESAARGRIVDMLRGIVPPLLSSRGGCHINMWGDAIVATFSEPSDAVSSAVKFIRHLSVESLESRVGMAWGSVRRGYNPAIGRFDIDGETVNFAARLEPMASRGEILLAPEFAAFEIDSSVGELVRTKRTITKAFAQYKAGDEIEVIAVNIQKN